MIYTFYSYKGGVGRSMALANVAAWFYEQGLRVAVVDWDLEAPGLETFFVSEDEVEKVRARPGLIDMLLAYKDQYPFLPLTAAPCAPGTAMADASAPESQSAPPLNANAFRLSQVQAGIAKSMEQSQELAQDAPGPPRRLSTPEAVKVLEEHLSPLAYMFYPLRPPKQTDSSKKALWLLSAGWRTKERFADYGREVQNFSWSEFYESYHGEAYFEWMRRQFNASDFADVVLIDSRTGLTEMGGVCTRQLADVVVSLTAPNLQNLSGVVRMAASFKKKEVLEARNQLEPGEAIRPLEIIFVPTRVENSELTELNRFKTEFNEQLNEYPASFRILKRSFWDLAIPYIAKYAYRERVAIGDKEGSDLLQNAYKTLAAHLVLLAPEGSALRSRFREELRRIFGNIVPRVLFPDDGQGSDSSLGRLRQELEKAGISLWNDASPNEGKKEALSQLAANIDLVEILLLPVMPEDVHTEAFRQQWRYARQYGVCLYLVKKRPHVEFDKESLPLWLRDLHIFDPEDDLKSLINILKNPCTAARVPLMMPDLPDGYIARPAENERLIAALLKARSQDQPTAAQTIYTDAQPSAQSSQPVRVALCGPVGSGKTMLAQAACHDERALAAFFDGVLWVTLGENPNIPAEMAKLYNALTGENRDATRTDTGDILTAKLAGKNCLLVVDHVWTESDLNPFLNLIDHGALLFTTQDQSLASRFEAERIVVGEMKAEESVELLARESKLALTPDFKSALRAIAELTGELPLPLKLAAVALKERLAIDKSPGEALTSVQSTLATSRGIVAFDQKGTGARDRSATSSITASLRRLSAYERDCYLKLPFLQTMTDVSLSDLNILWGTNEAETLAFIERFSTLSLLEYDQQRQRIKLNRMMQSFLRAQLADPTLLNAKIESAESIFASLTPDEQAIARRVLLRLIHLTGPADELPDTRRRWELEQFEAKARDVVKTLLSAQLLTLETESASGHAQVQLADDALVQSWTRLRGWLNNERPFLLWRQSLETRVAEWESSKRHNRNVLLEGKDLEAAKTWRDKYTDDLSESEKLFISESERVTHELKKTQRKAVAAASLLLLLSILLVGYFHLRAQRATRQKEVALQALGDVPLSQTKANDQGMESEQAVYEKMLASYDKLIEDDPNFAEAYDARGDIKTRLGNYDQAIADYQLAIKIRPDYQEAWSDLGAAYKLKGDKEGGKSYDAALDAYRNAIHLKRDDADSYFGMGEVYRAKGDLIYKITNGKGDKSSYDSAIEAYGEAISRLNPGNAEVFFKRGLAYRAKGDTTRALADFQKALSLPADDVLRENIRSNLLQLKVESPTTAAAAPPKIFIQYNDPDDEEVVDEIAAELKNLYTVVGTPHLSSGMAYKEGDVRCFNQSDIKNTKDIAAVVQASLSRQGFTRTIRDRFLGDYHNVPPGNIEIWIPSLQIPLDTEQHPTGP